MTFSPSIHHSNAIETAFGGSLQPGQRKTLSSLTSPVLPEKESSASDLSPCPSSRSELPNDRALVVHRAPPTPLPIPATITSPDRRRLQVILPTSNGSYDKQNPVSSDVLHNSSLLELFELVCNRRAKPEETLSQLIFRFNWDPTAAFVVNKTDDDESWEEVKEEVKDAYMMAKQDMPERRKFQVMVKDTSGPQQEDW